MQRTWSWLPRRPSRCSRIPWHPCQSWRSWSQESSPPRLPNDTADQNTRWKEVHGITYHAVDELEILRALRVAVASTILSTSLVGGEASHATILVHLREVKRAIETARKSRHVHIKRELCVQELEHVVARVGVHEVETRTNVLVSAVGDEVEFEGRAGRGDTVGTLVVSTVQSAVGSAGGRVGAEGSVPGVARVAVRVAAVDNIVSGCIVGVVCMLRTKWCGASASWHQGQPGRSGWYSFLLPYRSPRSKTGGLPRSVYRFAGHTPQRVWRE